MGKEFIINAPTVCNLLSCTNVACVMIRLAAAGWIGICAEHVSDIATSMMFEESMEHVVSLRAVAKRIEEVTPHA